MAKKLIYNYKFTPGPSNVGNLEIQGNYPIKVWQLVTDTGTGGLYPHVFVRDEYAATTGAIEIISGGSGDLTVAVTGTTFNETTGVMTVTTTTPHGLSTGATIKFRLRGVTFTCAKDNHATDHPYPRETDPIFDTAVPITAIDGDTFTVETGRPGSLGKISSYNEILYNFSDPLKSGSTFYDAERDKTIMTFVHDTSHLDPLDQIQIFVDLQDQKIDFSETFTDPVSKLRVSNPQNLIDTDFEYGLQPTKWETVELVNNVPAFYSSSSDYSIADVTDVTSTINSDFITVKTLDPHGLTVGAPIDVQGLSSRTAEGKFLVTRVLDNTTFVYKAKTVQSESASLNGSYTVIIPGQFYAGSDIAVNDESGVETDGASPSTLTISTDYTHGFAEGSSVYLTNTIGREIYDTEAAHGTTAPDGRPYIDHVNDIPVNVIPDLSMTETKEMTGMYARKFKSSDVNVANNTISWPNHQLRNGDCLLYIPPSGDSAIGGLDRFRIYYVKNAPTEDTLTLCAMTRGRFSDNSVNPEISFTNAGTSNYGRHQLILCYEIDYWNKSYYSYDTSMYTRYRWTGTGSGWDFNAKGYSTATNGRGGYWGLSGDAPERVIYVTQPHGYGSSSTYNLPQHVVAQGGLFGTRDNSNFTFSKSGTVPDGWDFIEDYRRWENYSNYNNRNNYFYSSSPGYMYHRYLGQYGYYSSGNKNFGGGNYSGQNFMIWLKKDPESDSFYAQNHGLSDRSTITVNRNSGNDIRYRTETSTSWNASPQFATMSNGTVTTVERLSNDRLRIADAKRLSSAVGNYDFDGNRTNEFANSVFFRNHNLVSGQKVLIEPLSGGSLPSTTTGVSNPDIQTIDTVYKKTIEALDEMRSANSSDFTTWYFNGNSHYYPMNSYNSFYDGARQYMYFVTYSFYIRQYFTSGGSSSYSTSLSNSSLVFRTGQPVDLWASTNLGGKGYLFQSTPYERNSSQNYFVEVRQIPYTEGVQRTQWYTSSSGSYKYGGNSFSRYNSPEGSANEITSLGNGWRFQYDAAYSSPNTSYHGHWLINIRLTNDGWPGYYATDTGSAYYGNSRGFHHQNYQYRGTSYEIDVKIPIKGGVTGSRYGQNGTVKNSLELATEIATKVSATLTNPEFATSGITTAFASQIGANRISFRTIDGVPYDLTNAGIAPIRVGTEELTGTVDGYYNIDSSSNTQIKTFLNTRVPKRVLSKAADQSWVTIGDFNYLNFDNHKLKTSQKLIYAGPTIAGITSGTTYYAVVDGPNHFRLATSSSDAAGNNAVGGGTTTATENVILTIPSIAGVSSGPGLVGVSSEKTTITGTDCLFKRFFKSGDSIKIANTSMNPPEYVDYTVASVIDDNQLTISEIPGVDLNDTSYYVETKMYPRPDGTFVHRPFDGGVEITAGTSPNSSIVRQTRKYFRYQSGKGIQCSVAVNFNPSRVANTLVGTANTSLPKESYELKVNNNGAGSYAISGSDRDVNVVGANPTISVMAGDTLTFRVNATGHNFWIKDEASTGTVGVVTEGTLSGVGTDVGTVSWDTNGVTPGTYYYACQYHSSMQGLINVEPAGITTSIAKLTTKYPHGITRRNSVTVRGSSESEYNGSFSVVHSDPFNIYYYLTTVPEISVPNGIIEYGIDGYDNSAVRCGLFDYQNGMFFEFDGQDLYAVRRSSVQQLPGSCRVTTESNIVLGNDTNFTGQLESGTYIVIRGQSYRITDIKSRTELHISPSYRGQSASDAIITKTIDIKVPQSEWSLDKADGEGPSGFKLDMTKIQMCYIDYSWYGAGKIRFGFKDAKGHVKYMHEFLHNNRLEEAYMRSGNIPGRYEIENSGRPSYVPSLFHWGTSVMMDGGFDDDKAYLFTAPSQNLIFTNGDSSEATTTAQSSLIYRYNYSRREYEFYVRLRFANNDASKFTSGTPLYTVDNVLNGQQVSYTDYSGGNFNAYIFISSNRRYRPPSVYPVVANATAVSVGAPASGSSDIELTQEVPLVSIRLAPSVDNNLTGALGARAIINRMQLQLKSLGITVSHDCEVDVILNGASSNQSFENVTSPSLSEIIKHAPGDKIIGGTKIFSLRASGGTENAAGKRLSATSDFDLSQIIDLGNSIMGGDGVFPNGPDLLTIALVPVDTSEINAQTPLTVSARITWTESQA